FLVIRTRVINRGTEAQAAHLYFSIRPYNPEGISLIKELEFVEDHIWRVNGQTGVILLETPDRVCCSNLREGYVSFLATRSLNRRHVTCEFGMATGLAEYALPRKEGAKRDILVLLTLDPLRQGTLSFPAFATFDYPSTRHQFRDEWQKKTAEGAHLQ